MKVDQDIIQVLDAALIEGNLLTLRDELDRQTYVRVAKVLAMAGGQWDRKSRGHAFQGSAADAIEQIILSEEVRNTKQDFGQFDTPPSVVRQVLDAAAIEPGMLVLEPSAGIGNLAVPAIEIGAKVHTVEIDPRRNALLTMRIAKLPIKGAVQFSTGMKRDFLGLDAQPVYDRVIMNPPFAQRADIKHVRHASGFLRSGGRLVAIMSAGVAFRTDSVASSFREFVWSRRGSIAPLSENAFAESGTFVKTVLVSLPAQLGEA